MSDADRLAQEERTRCLQKVSEQAFRTMPEDDLIRCLDAVAHTGGGHDRTAADYRNELTRRAANHHADQIKAYARRLDGLTRGLFGLTVVIVLQTTVIIALEVESHHPGQGRLAGSGIVVLAIVMLIVLNWSKDSRTRQ